MSLTVPKAGSTAGRAANIRVEAPQTGSAVAEFGQQLNQIGEALENDYLGREAQRFQVDLTADMNDLRLEVSQIGDPDQAEAVWNQRTQAMREAYAGGQTEDGRPRVHPKNQEKFGLVFDELRNANAFSLGKQTLVARQAQREATYIRYAQTATQQGASADPEMRETLLQNGYSQIDAMVDAGIIDAAEAEKRKLGLAQDMDNARAIEMVASNPEGFLALNGDGDFAALPAEIQARYRVQAQGNIDRAAAAAQTAAEKAAKEQEILIGNRLREIRDIRAGGMTSVDEAWLASDEAKSHPDYPKTMAKISLTNEQPRLAQMTPAQMDALIAGEKSRPVAHKYQTERLAMLEILKEEAEVAWQKDQVEYARDIDLYVPDLPDFDPNNPAAYGKGLRQRVQAAKERVSAGYVKRPEALSETEREALEVAAKPEARVKDRLALAKALALGYGDDGRKEAARLNSDPVFGWVTSLVGQGLPDKTARDILSGQTKLAQKTVAVPSRADAIEVFHTSTENNFRDLPQMTEAVIGSALAHYAENNPTADPTTLDQDAFEKSVSLVLGATAGRNGDLSVGGIQRIDNAWLGSGYLLPLPPGIATEEVETVIRTVRSDLGQAKPDLSRLASASVSGGTPDFEGSDPADIWDQTEFVPYWPDGRQSPVYVLQRMRGGRPTYVADTNGSIFKVDLAKLITGSAP